jgi:hypothetical protein
MASLAQSILSAKTLLVCLGLSPAVSSGTGALLMLLALFIVFLVPFDRRLLDWYAKRVGDKALQPASSKRSTHLGKRRLDYGFGETAMTGGPCTRQVCKMLDLEVVSIARRKFFVGCYLVELAIGRWNEEDREFEVVTEWCETREELEEKARQAMKSFRGIAKPKYRGASNV